MKKTRTTLYNLKSYIETTKSGIKLVYTPNKNNFTSITFIINSGSCYKDNDESLLFEKFISYSLKDNDLFKYLLNNSITFTSDIDFHSSYYQFNTFLSGEDIILYFINKLNSFSPTEEMIDNFINYINVSNNQPSLQLKKYLCDNLFSSSPMRKGNLLLPSDISKIYIGGISNYFIDAYKSENISIHISGPLSKKEIKKLFVSLNNSISYFNGQDLYEIKSYNEDASFIKKGFVSIPTKSDISYLSCGIKLPSFDQIMGRFNNLAITLLYLTKYICFDLNSDFIQGISSCSSELLLTDIESNGKEGLLYIIFKTSKADKLMTLVNSFISRLQSRFSREVFLENKKQVFAFLYDKLNHPQTFIKSLNYPYHKVMEYTKVISQIKKVKYEELVDFILYLTTFARSFVEIKSSLSEK